LQDLGFILNENFLDLDSRMDQDEKLDFSRSWYKFENAIYQNYSNHVFYRFLHKLKFISGLVKIM